MEAKKCKVSFTFVDPNRAADFERMLCRIVVEKLSAQQKPAVIQAA